MGRTIYICCGMSGSGKTTYLKRTPSSEDVVLTRDSFGKIWGYETKKWYEFISSEIRRHRNKTIFIDQTTRGLHSLQGLMEGVEWCEGDEFVLLAFTASVEECRERVMRRQHGNINKGLQYVFEDNVRANPQISKEELKSFHCKHKITWRSVDQ